MSDEGVEPVARPFDLTIERALSTVEPLQVRGRVAEAVGGIVKATGVEASLGETCEFRDRRGGRLGIAEVVGFAGQWTYLSPLGRLQGLSPRVEVLPLGSAHTIGVGRSLRGRVLDGFGAPIDGRGPIEPEAQARVDADPPDPLSRLAVREPLVTGLRAIDGLLTCGVGQRVGVFAPPGAGKSTLLGWLARHTAADTVVIALVGERGREVGEFVRTVLGTGGSQRAIVVAATSDRPAMERVKAAQVATAIAEHFRDRGQHVLLLVDSLTRLARAQREIGLSMGEPPTRRGFPPSVFSMLPRLLERAGPGHNGAITAFYSVLVEGEEIDDPIGEEVKAIVDGHLSLSRSLAASARFPAIDILESGSRVMDLVADPRHRMLATEVRQLMARYREVEMLVQIGEYAQGSDPLADRAIAVRSELERFLLQPSADDPVRLAATLARLAQAIGKQ